MNDESIAALQQRESALREVIAGARCILWEARVTRRPDNTFAWKLQILSPPETRREFGFIRTTQTDDNDVYVQQLPPDEAERMNQNSHRALSNGDKAYRQEFCIHDAEGRLRYMSEDVRIMPVAPGVYNLIGVQVDITERKRAEAALWRAEEQLRQSQKLQAVGHFAAGTAHYFKNLLQVIDSYTERLKKLVPAGGPHSKDLEMVKKALQLATEMNRRLMFFGRQPQQSKPIDINALIMEMDSMLRPIIGKDIELNTMLDSKLNLVKADPRQIEQAIVNLTLNARDAMPLGGKLVIETLNVEVDSRFANDDISLKPGPYALIVVSDTGFGMDQEIISHLFEPFFTTKGITRGAGLGLAIVYAIVRNAGGNVQVASEPGKGTRFKIYLPAMVNVPKEPAVSKER